jgi:beta-galactosidase
MMVHKFFTVAAVVLIAVTLGYSQTYTPEPNNRVKINLGETPWKFIKSDPPTAKDSAFNDAAGKDVGIPHTPNDDDTYVNGESGGGPMFGNNCWYRKHFTLDSKYAGRKIFIEIEGAHVGCQVYINGTFIPGNSALNTAATHVIGFIGFVVDVTNRVTFGGADNVLAVRVGGVGGFYADPGFSLVFRFGQGDIGIFRPVWLHITDKVHVPLNVYSVLNKWGTYVATTAANASSATVRIQTNVQNEGSSAQSVTLTTKVVDAAKTVVWSEDKTQTADAGAVSLFDQTATISSPHLWYPNNSTYGKPYMYKVYHIVKIGGTTVDVFESPLGIRTIVWDANFPYFNGNKHCLYGASARYDYPALGTALPPEIEYRDAKLLANIGGSLWRPGHSSCSRGFVEACDAYGVMLIQPSGEGEGAFSSGAITDAKRTLKTEIQRDVIIRDRNNPSILAWEASNADIEPAFADAMRALNHTWDNITPRVSAVRGGPQFAPGDLIACTVTGCEIGLKNGHPLCPAWGAEAWGKQASRFAYDQEIAFAGEFIQNWRKNVQANCFGLCQWYLAETPGEAGNFLEGVMGPGVRSFGSSMMDFSRIPKMLYKIYSTAWIPYATKPQVYLAHHWNRSGTVRVNAFSNCPSVKLTLNGNDLGTKTPNPWNGTGGGIDNNTTQLPHQCWWDGVAWAAGTLRAEGLDASGKVVCFDEKKTAGAPHHIVLTRDEPIVKPNGDTFMIKANGTDAITILATVVDAQGIWCPTANMNITFSTNGDCEYRGGADQYVTTGKGFGYHAPLDPELTVEGGMCKIAVRSRFAAGNVTVTAKSGGLGDGTLTFPIGMPDPVLQGPRNSLAGSSFMQAFKIQSTGNTIQYFISRPAAVSVEILNANGRVIHRIPSSVQGAGWHPVSISGDLTAGAVKSNGVYFVRFAVDKKYSGVKRIICVR